MREGKLPKLMQAALEQRLSGSRQLPDTDVVMMLDGGREGLVRTLMCC